jgi:DNA polymerase
MTEDKASRLEVITNTLTNMTESPLYEYRQQHQYKPVPGEGSPDARIMFIGEAPGATEAKTGRPFVGASGRFLNEMLASIGLQRDDVYITNIVKDRPPDNRDPKADEIALYTPLLLAQIEVIQPAVIATLGRFAMDFILATFQVPEHGQKISDLHGRQLRAQTSYDEITIIPLFHPAVALYNVGQKEALLNDFQALKAFV